MRRLANIKKETETQAKNTEADKTKRSEEPQSSKPKNEENINLTEIKEEKEKSVEVQETSV